MKKVIAIIGTETRRQTYRALQQFERDLKERGDVDFEYLFLSDYNLEYCHGCKVCFDRGEDNCPIRDDRDIILQKMDESDGIVFATPSYAFHVTARMKNMLDRLAYVHHRPRFFGKACTAIVTRGVPMGGGAIAKYLCSTGENMGCHASKGCSVLTLEPVTPAQQEKINRNIAQAADRFHRELLRATPAPSFYRLMAFRLTRTVIRLAAADYYDHPYYKERGWFESDYYYETALNPAKKAAGAVFDVIGRQMAKRR